MPIQTVICPDCANVITTDVPIGLKATIEHRDGVDMLRVRPRVLPILVSLSERRAGFEPKPNSKRG